MMIDYDLANTAADEFCNLLSTAQKLQAFNIDKITAVQLRNEQSTDDLLSPIIDECKTNNNFSLTRAYELKDDILFKHSGQLLVVPASLRRAVLENYHTHPLGAHMARDRLFHILKTRFYWSGMLNHIRAFCRSCLECAKVKSRAPIKAGLLVPITSFRPFLYVGSDIVICRQSNNSNRYILVAIDYFTNFVEAAPMKTLSAEELVRVFFHIIIARHGCPQQLISDSGTQFVASLFLDLCKSFNITKAESSPYHQQANGNVSQTSLSFGHTVSEAPLLGRDD